MTPKPLTREERSKFSDFECLMIAEELAGRADTVSILTCDEFDALYLRAKAGEFDGMFTKIGNRILAQEQTL